MKPEIILVDDDEITLFLHKRQLIQAGLAGDVQSYNSASDFIESFQNYSVMPHPGGIIVLIDINMPETDGWACAEILKEQTHLNDAEVFLLTSSIDPADKQRAESSEFINGYLIKPLKLQELQSLSRLL